MYFVYILQSIKNKSFYKASTNELNRRFAEHNSGKDFSTARYAPWQLVWFTKKSNKSEAMILEKKLKNLSVERTIAFIDKYPTEIEDGITVTPPLRQ